MTVLAAQLDQSFATPAELAAATRAAVGKSLRRPSGLTQLALAGALACLPPEKRERPTALFWQSTSGPRAETQILLAEMRADAEPMPYDFLATQPAIAAATLQPWLPGLIAATHWPLPEAGETAWGPLLALAIAGLAAGRCEQALVAHLDSWGDTAHGRWLLLSAEAGTPLADLRLVAPEDEEIQAVADTPDLPQQIADWLAAGTPEPLRIRLPAGYRQRVEFARRATR